MLTNHEDHEGLPQPQRSTRSELEGSPQRGVHVTKGNVSEGKKTQSAIKRLAAMPWTFGGFGLFLTACVIAFILTFQYIALSNNVENMVVGKATAVLDRAVQSARGYRAKVERVSGLIQQDLSKAGNTSQDPYYFINSLNSTLRRTVGARVRSRLIHIVVVYVLGGPVPLVAFPKQTAADLLSCRFNCAPPGAPTFKKAVAYGLIRDFTPETQDEYRSISANPNNTSTFYILQKVNLTIMPSWAETDDLSNKALIPLSPFVTRNFAAGFINGSAFDGNWLPVEVTSSAGGFSYYYTGFSQQFVHPYNNLTVVVNILPGIEAFQDVLAKSTLSRSISSNAHLMLVDHLARVITYNHDIYGDRRLANCTVIALPETPNRPCGDLYGDEHPTPFIARLFQNHKAFIMSFTRSARQMWFSDEGNRYLLVAQDISSNTKSRIAAVFVLSEQEVVGNLKRDTLVLVLVSAAVVLIGCLVLVAAGFASLRNAQRTVVLVAKLASSIARYDVDAADATIAEEQSSRCLSAVTPMEKQFSEIIDNLRTYRLFLPSSLLVGTHCCTGSGSSSLDTIPFPLHVNNANKFVPFVGSLVLVDIGNLPIAAHVPRRSAEAGGHVINAFLTHCLWIVERHGGVAESIQANQLLASFNCHTSIPQHQQAACRCALELQTVLTGESAWCAYRINVAISVASGGGLLGSGGTATVRGRLIAGEVVDLIKRLPSLQRLLGVCVLATDATATALSGAVVAVPIDVISPMWGQEGRSSAIIVYEVVATTKLVTPQVLKECKIRTMGFTQLHHNRDPAKAATTFLRLPSDVMGRYSVMRLIYLSEILAKQSYSNLHRNEAPWEELEGRAFFDLHNAEMVESIKTKKSDPLHPQRITNTQLTYDSFDSSFGCSLGANPHTSVSWDGYVSGMNNGMSRSFNGGDKHNGSLHRIDSTEGGASMCRSLPEGGCDASDSISHQPHLHTTKAVRSILRSRNASPSLMQSRSNANAPSFFLTAVSGDKYYPSRRSLRSTGRGSLGKVTLALHETGGLVAMKQIPLNTLDEGVEPVIQEMKRLSSLNHPNISSYVTCAVNEEDSTFCIMNEYLPAGSLYELLCASAVSSVEYVLSTPTTIKFATDIANGLHHLHTRTPPILHLDVKPQNVLMTAEGSCKLIDFGTSKLFSEGTSAHGTARYMAPEAAAGEFSAASDVYSLGITVLHMLLGRPPWDHVPGDDNSFLSRLTQDATLRPNIPDWVDPKLGALLERCTSRDPTHRPSAKQFVEEATSIV